MKQYAVVFSKQALRDLQAIRRYFSGRFTTSSANAFAEDLVANCYSLSSAPYRGMQVPGKAERFRLMGIGKGRVSVVFEIGADAVMILALRYGGYR